ncbi:MAG: hypothetical protein PWQ38_700 [Proteiniphilum sp.]|jgi:hypothetical protein|nr:hypothetical protein [Proteiniphilum sp.]
MPVNCRQIYGKEPVLPQCDAGFFVFDHKGSTS